MKSLVILISGRGSNMQVLLDAKLPAKAITVISNNPAAAGLGIARLRHIETHVVDHRAYPNRETFDAALAEKIDACQPDLVALAGFMRILGDSFVSRYQNRLINVHPSLLPAFSGLNTHARALKEGVKIHGCTVHFVTSQLDHGPIIIQAAVPVLAEDTTETLAARVLQQEHLIYPQAVRWFLEDRLMLTNDCVKIRAATVKQRVLYSPHLDQ
ncbi:phosphoribosylglycinamide formyltransferase [Nitrosomonas sp. Is37]|uniref:phosphoribosylglycinamide formyltransferase n=1 Tax=Nitrosomonas sp. Is37 TaxID=3080535 RepID=UPI00294ABF04|nr:phosphoribosylglycinamide formyltransferase [Nitrosomonas sp. Is37]MDV6343571.1 phosphoribosylglycinamide formyltransferase [Nitrosomonas sp. Is37]